MGNGYSPRIQPRAPRGARRSRFRRDVPQGRLFCRPAAPVRTAAVPNCFFEAPGSSGTSAATELSAAVRSGLPQSRGSRPFGAMHLQCRPSPQCLRAPPGTPAAGRAACGTSSFNVGCAGTAAVRPASPALSRAAVSSLTHRLRVARPILAAKVSSTDSAGRRAVRLRLLTRAIVRYRRVGRTR
jgi:hypothetical protein